jgi:hypothetical protein
MIFIITLLFYLYILVVVLTIATLLLIAPILMEKLPWANEKKVLTILPVYLFFIPLAIISIWKFQDWKGQYENRTGHAKISMQYRDFLENKYPQLGEAYQRVIADHYMLSEHLHYSNRDPITLANHSAFIKEITQRWQMVLDQLKTLKKMIEAQARRPNDSPNAALILTKNVNFYFEQIKNSKKYIELLMRQHTATTILFLTDPNSNSPHFPIEQKNYEHIIHFFLSRYNDDDNNLIVPLNLIIQTIHQSNQIIKLLNQKLKQRKLYSHSIITEVLKAWKHTKYYSHARLFKILYSLETEYVLQRMHMQDSHPDMQKLQLAINTSIQSYSHDVNTLRLATEQSNNPKTVLALH